ncbi:glycosyltransferase family protein [Microbacterium gorillae]|uniref:glycosyltransferase family protein n=1 Tax=Microbacterium gorillae TaxID=1231063 RepID=UPI003D97E6C7
MSAPRILLLSHSHAFGPFRVGSHHYARTLAESGADVVHLSTPVSAAHRVTGRIDRATLATLPRGPVRDAAGVTHLVPRTLVPVPYGRFRVDRALRRHGIAERFDAVLIDQPLLWHDSVRSLTERLVYRPTDMYPDGVKHGLQERIIAAADGVLATSSAVLDALGDLRVPTLVIENGVDADRFAAPQGNGVREALCVYVGALDGRFDWEQLGAWGRGHPDVRFVVAGPGAAPAVLPSNVEMLGAIAYDQLPALLHRARVGLLPLSDDPLNEGRSPMKLYEYLAAGTAVVTRETPVLHADAESGVYTYRDTGDADAALRSALAHPSPNAAGVRRAAYEGWGAKTAQLQRFALGLAPR